MGNHTKADTTSNLLEYGIPLEANKFLLDIESGRIVINTRNLFVGDKPSYPNFCAAFAITASKAEIPVRDNHSRDRRMHRHSMLLLN
jgi:hypothetical protein